MVSGLVVLVARDAAAAAAGEQRADDGLHGGAQQCRAHRGPGLQQVREEEREGGVGFTAKNWSVL